MMPIVLPASLGAGRRWLHIGKRILSGSAVGFYFQAGSIKEKLPGDAPVFGPRRKGAQISRLPLSWEWRLNGFPFNPFSKFIL